MGVNSRTQSAVPSAEDLRLWVRALATDRDKAAFARLFEYFAPRLIAFFMRAGHARDVAEEIAQDTMIAVWRKASLYDSVQAGVSTWVFTIGRNCRVDRLRREGRRSRTEIDAVEEPGADVSGEDRLLADERDARVRDAVNSLPPDQAAVVRLSFFAEKPHAEIAGELGLPLGTVKSRLRLALAKIRAAWETDL
jgi:RNA polymerase sigma-70 factor, ECF subfamily